MKKFHIQMTDDEAALLTKIDLRDQLPPEIDPHDAYQNNRKPIVALLRSLKARGAIPSHRISYFTNPEYKPGRTKGSRQDLFQKDNEGVEVWEHPNFKRHLRYFLFGTDLPDGAILEFEDGIRDPKWINGSDGIDLGKKAIKIARKYGIQKREAADNFFKLCLDIGISFSQADMIQGIVRRSSLK